MEDTNVMSSDEEGKLVISPPKKRKKTRDVLDTKGIPEEIVEVMKESGIDDMLEKTANKVCMTASHVKKIIKDVLTHDNILQQCRRILTGEPLSPQQIVLTRSKAKEQMKETEIIPTMATTEFPEEEEDEDYNPDDDLQNASDDESGISNYGTPHSSKTLMSPTPFGTPSSLNDSISLEPCIKSSNFSTASRTLEFVSDENLICSRTRSKYSYTNTSLEDLESALKPPDINCDILEQIGEPDPVWEEFLQEFNKPLSSNEINEDDDDSDYNINVDADFLNLNDLKWEYRQDKGVKISKLEHKILMEEFIDSFTHDDKDDTEADTQRKNKRRDELFWKLNQPCEESSDEEGRQLLSQEGSRGHEKAYSVEGSQLITCSVLRTFPIELEKILQNQLMQHIQLLSTSSLLCSHDHTFVYISHRCKSMLTELQCTLQNISLPYYPWNLKFSLDMISQHDRDFHTSVGSTSTDDLRTSGCITPKIFPPNLTKTFLESPAFPFAKLLPTCLPKTADTHFKVVKKKFLPPEDMLIALKLEALLSDKGKFDCYKTWLNKGIYQKLSEELTKLNFLIHSQLGIKNHLRSFKPHTHLNNPIAVFFRNLKKGEVYCPTSPLTIEEELPGMPCPLINVPEHHLPHPWRHILKEYVISQIPPLNEANLIICQNHSILENSKVLLRSSTILKPLFLCKNTYECAKTVKLPIPRIKSSKKKCSTNSRKLSIPSSFSAKKKILNSSKKFKCHRQSEPVIETNVPSSQTFSSSMQETSLSQVPDVCIDMPLLSNSMNTSQNSSPNGSSQPIDDLQSDNSHILKARSLLISSKASTCSPNENNPSSDQFLKHSNTKNNPKEKINLSSNSSVMINNDNEQCEIVLSKIHIPAEQGEITQIVAESTLYESPQKHSYLESANTSLLTPEKDSVIKGGAQIRVPQPSTGKNIFVTPTAVFLTPEQNVKKIPVKFRPIQKSPYKISPVKTSPILKKQKRFSPKKLLIRNRQTYILPKCKKKQVLRAKVTPSESTLKPVISSLLPKGSLSAQVTASSMIDTITGNSLTTSGSGSSIIKTSLIFGEDVNDTSSMVLTNSVKNSSSFDLVEEDEDLDAMDDEFEIEDEDDLDQEQQKEEHLAALVKASATIHSKKGERKVSTTNCNRVCHKMNKHQRSLQARIVALARVPDNEVQSKALSLNFLIRVRDVLLPHDTERFEEFINILKRFELHPYSPETLYFEIAILLKDYPHILDEFVSFLMPHQAIQVGKFAEYSVMQRFIEFVEKIQHHFGKDSPKIIKIIRMLQSAYKNPNLKFDDVKAMVSPILRYPHLVESFIQCFPAQIPAQCLTDDFEEVNIDEPASPEGAEYIKLADEDHQFSPDHCSCNCHVSSVQDTQQQQHSGKPDHCNSCAMRFIDGRVYLQCGKSLKPAKVTYLATKNEENTIHRSKTNRTQSGAWSTSGVPHSAAPLMPGHT